MPKKTPLIMSLNLDRDLYVTKLIPLDKTVTNWKKIDPYESQYPLPSCHNRSLSYDPFGILIATDTKIEVVSGWKLLSSKPWKESDKRHRSDLVKNALRSHMRKRNNVINIGREWSYYREDVFDDENLSSVIHHCLSAWYVEVGDVDGIAYDFVRKARSASSIQEELDRGVFPYGEGSDFNEVMVNIDSGNHKFSSGKLRRIDENENLNMKIEGTDHTIKSYDEENGFTYSNEEAKNTCVAYVEHGNKRLVYAATRVYRVLRIEDWQGNLKSSMNELMRLKPSEFYDHLRRGLKLLRGFRFGGELVKFDLPKDVTWDVKVADVASDCSLVNSPGQKKLLFNGKWKHHIGKYPVEPYPEVSVSYCVHEDDLWALETLRSYNDSVFAIVPEWRKHNSEQTILIKGESQTEITQSIKAGIKKLNEIEGEQLVVSGLRPSRPGNDPYNWLKKRLTEIDVKHQNYQINSRNTFNAPNSAPTHEMNVCQLLLKFGRLPVPFKIDIGKIDLVVGVDIGRLGKNRSRPAMAVSLDRFGNMYGGSVSAEPQPGEEMSNRTLRDLIDNQVNRYEEVAKNFPSRVLIIRDGNSSKQELKDMNHICEEWLKLGVDIAWITLQKSGTPRLLIFEENEIMDRLPEPQSYLITSERTAWCWTTGGPVGRFPGIPRGFSFRLERQFSINPLSMEEWCRVLIAQAKTSQVNPYSNTKLPFTLHLADKMAKALIRGAIPPNYNGSGFPAC